MLLNKKMISNLLKLQNDNNRIFPIYSGYSIITNDCYHSGTIITFDSDRIVQLLLYYQSWQFCILASLHPSQNTAGQLMTTTTILPCTYS